MDAAELAELEAQLARAEERIVQEIERLKGVSDRADLTLLFNRCCTWYVNRVPGEAEEGEEEEKEEEEDETEAVFLVVLTHAFLILRCFSLWTQVTLGMVAGVHTSCSGVWEMTSLCFRICGWLIPMPLFQEQIVVMAWFFVVEQLVAASYCGGDSSCWNACSNAQCSFDVSVGAFRASGTHFATHSGADCRRPRVPGSSNKIVEVILRAWTAFATHSGACCVPVGTVLCLRNAFATHSGEDCR